MKDALPILFQLVRPFSDVLEKVTQAARDKSPPSISKWRATSVCIVD
jgi:hypothetical protein